MILGALDAVVYPSRYDPYGMAAHESLCRGLPTFISTNAGVSEMVPADLPDLILNRPESVSELCDRLRRWRKNMERYQREVAPLAEFLRKRTWGDMATDFVKAVTD
jgi:glycosyltransferase involved in cell wall biosynthesis